MTGENPKALSTMKPPQAMLLRLTTHLTAETLAEEIVAGLGIERESFILELLEALDSEMMEWAFSLRVVLHTLKLARQYVDEEYSEGGSEHTRLSGMIDELSDALRRERRVRHGIDDK